VTRVPSHGIRAPARWRLQLADAARPGVPLQHLAGVAPQRHVSHPHPGPQRPDEMAVSDPRSRSTGRCTVHGARCTVKTARRSRGRCGTARRPLSAITVGRGDQADIGLERRRSPEPLGLPLLQHAEELRLHRGRELTDLVEEVPPAARSKRPGGHGDRRSRGCGAGRSGRRAAAQSWPTVAVALGAAPRPRGAPAGVQARDRPGPGSGRNPAGSRGPSASDRASARRPADSCVLPVLVASKDRTQLGQPIGAVSGASRRANVQRHTRT
jgi:hypothetical protein